MGGNKSQVLLVPFQGWGVNAIDLIPVKVFECHFTVKYMDSRLSSKSYGPTGASKYLKAHCTGDIEAPRKYPGLAAFSLAGHSAAGHLVTEAE